MEIELDPRKAALNRRKHGVRFSHAEDALMDVNALTLGDHDSMGEFRWVTMGMDALGRILVVVYTEREGILRIISARKASVGEARQYHA